MRHVTIEKTDQLCQPDLGVRRVARLVAPDAAWRPERYEGSGWPEGVERLFRQVRTKAFFMVSGTPVAAGHLRRGNVVVRRLLDEGVRVRILHSGEGLEARAPAALRDRVAAGAEIRVTDTALCNAVILDGKIAVLWASDALDGGYSSVVLRDPAAVSALCRLGTAAWTNARDLAEHAGLPADGFGEAARTVLAMLCSGLTDEVAARELEVSVRTYRRHVAEIMQALGAESRFQAGVRAAELGLIQRG